MSEGSGTALTYPRLSTDRLSEIFPDSSIPDDHCTAATNANDVTLFSLAEDVVDSALSECPAQDGFDDRDCSAGSLHQEITAKEWGKVYGQAYALTGNSADAEDAVQEAYLQLFQAGVKGHRIESTTKWMRGVVRYVVIHMFHKSRRTSQISLDSERKTVENAASLARAAVSGGSIEDQVIEERLIRHSLRVIAQLPDAERECILMYAQGYSFVQIAKVLGMPYRTALNTTKKAIVKVRDTIRR